MDINVLKKFLAILAGVVCLFFGNDPSILNFVYALIAFQCFDIVVGLFVMFLTGEKFDYRFFAKGIIKKILYLLAVSFGYFVDKYNIFNATNLSFEKAFASAFIIVEVFSIIQSFSKAGIKIPLIDKYIKLD